MISRSGNRNFFVAHYDWLAAGIGVLALIAAAVFFATTVGQDPEESAAAESARIGRMKPTETGVKNVDMTDFQAAVRLTRNPAVIAEVAEKNESFLASERRVLCSKCKKVISGDIVRVPKCPYCGEKQEEEKKVVLDADGDGLPDEWEKRFGLNPNSAADAQLDADHDGFTNFEEYVAKTDPMDAKDHPDYLDSLKIVLPLKETKLPFVFRQANKIPAGWRCEFFDPSRKDDYGRRGATLTAVVGGEIADTGFVVKSYEQKSAKQAIKGGQGLTKTVDVSEAVIERKSDGKRITLVVQSGKAIKLAPVDVQATLAYERGTVQNLVVVPGSEIDLNGAKYRIVDIKPVGKGAKVTIENSLSGKKRVIEALEP